MSTEKVFSFASLQDRKTICKYLEVLKEGFEQGTINFSYKDSNLILEPHGLIKLEIKAGLEDKEVRLNLGFRWEEKEDAKFKVNFFEKISGSDQDK